MDKTVFYVLILLLFNAKFAAAETPDESLESLESPEIPQVLLDKVAQGDGESAYFIGNAFVKGEGAFDVDFEKAKHWFLKAAELNHAHGMFELGMLLFFDKDFKAAQNWFEQAAKQGHGESFYRLGIYSIYGLNDQKVACEDAYALFESAQSRNVQVAFNDHAWMLATLPDKACRNGEKAWRLYSKLERTFGPNGLIPLSYLDTKAAVLAEISEFNGAIKLQTYVVEEFCDVKLEDGMNINEWMALAAKQTPEFCSHGVERLKSYIDRKPWREQPEGDFEKMDTDNTVD